MGSIALTRRKLGRFADLPSRIGDRSHWPGASRVGPRISPSRLRIDRTDRAQARSARGSPRVALTDVEAPPAPGTPSRNRRLSRPLCGMASRVRWRLNTIRVDVSRSFHSLLSLAAQRLSKLSTCATFCNGGCNLHVSPSRHKHLERRQRKRQGETVVSRRKIQVDCLRPTRFLRVEVSPLW